MVVLQVNDRKHSIELIVSKVLLLTVQFFKPRKSTIENLVVWQNIVMQFATDTASDLVPYHFRNHTKKRYHLPGR